MLVPRRSGEERGEESDDEVVEYAQVRAEKHTTCVLSTRSEGGRRSGESVVVPPLSIPPTKVPGRGSEPHAKRLDLLDRLDQSASFVYFVQSFAQPCHD